MSKEYTDLIKQSNFFKQVGLLSKEVEMPKLNIASGPNVFPFDGWINYDIDDISGYINYISQVSSEQTIAPKLEHMPEHQRRLATYLRGGGKLDFRVHDLTNGFPQHADNSVRAIYAGQMIEHLNPIYGAPAFLKECYRMLKPGGVLRMTTPDLSILIQAYLDKKMDMFSIEQPAFYKNVTESAKLAHLMYGASGENCSRKNYEGHMFLYTQESMTEIIQKASFKSIYFYYESGKSQDPELAKESEDAGMSHSFIVEAVK